MKPRVTFYTRDGCCLCDEAKAVVLGAACRDEFEFEEVDVDSDEEIQARYTDQVPVILINGIKCFKYRVTEPELERKIRRFAG